MAIIFSKVINEMKMRRQHKEIVDYSTMYYNLSNMDNILNEFIIARFEDYQIKNVEKFNSEYINEAMQNEITSELLASVMETMSPLLKRQLCLIYSTDVIDQIIADRVIMIVMSHVIDNNSAIVNTTDLDL